VETINIEVVGITKLEIKDKNESLVSWGGWGWAAGYGREKKIIKEYYLYQILFRVTLLIVVGSFDRVEQVLNILTCHSTRDIYFLIFFTTYNL
jgi:hypothetical protein